MATSKTNEQAFEALIEKALVGSTIEERKVSGLINPDAQSPLSSQYYWGNPSDFEKKVALDQRRLWSFLQSTQQSELDKYVGKDLKTDLEKQIDADIKTFGVIQVLRKGVEVNNIKLSLFYPKPSAADSEKSKKDYASNQFSVTRQQTFSILNPGLEIDMVLFVNGLPIFTFELKNPWTNQTAKYDGQKQYKSVERNPKEPLLNYGRCLAHFTLDKDDVFFTTKLNLDKTFFMPFNKGLANGQGAGNPVNPNGYKTAYLWEDVLQKDTVSDIIMNYVLFDYDEAKTQKKVSHIMKNAKKLVFPRFHQLDVVSKLISDVANHGVGKTYLIEHSAGSGKSNSLTWLAFKLIRVCPDSLSAVRAKAIDAPLYNSVIVVTDRRILDKQITDNIKAFGQSDKIVAHADSSKDLKSAIENNKRIIITTIQKFPFICDAISDVSDHNFAVIIDEAHSSQSGIAADKLNATVQKDSDTDCGDTDALLEKLMKDRKMSSNCSYFAFTATPKKETLERFGTKDEEGRFHPFHLYSMKQAIEEGFILDVLTNYTTYKGYYELTKSIEENPEYNNDRAQKLLRQAVEREPKTIAAKADVMLAHFDAKVFRSHKLNGKAKAMVVTKDIECAILYYQALCKLIENKKMPYKILIAFSGEKALSNKLSIKSHLEDNVKEYGESKIEPPIIVEEVEIGSYKSKYNFQPCAMVAESFSKTYTEAELNGFPESKTPEYFDSDDYRILVVANKYLTGFDQPKLCAMYIDKPLDGVLAVQALSRLNRAAQDLGKRSEDLFILDFYNKTEDIKNAFDPFYTATTLSEATDVNVLHQLKNTLLSFGVFEMDEVDEFIDLYMNGAEADKWSPIIDECADRFNNDIEWDENGKPDFKMKCKQFVKVYSKVAAILPFEKADWEKLFWFLRFLIPQLVIPKPGISDLKDLLDSVDLNTYGLRRTALNETIKLDDEETVIDPLKPVMVNGGVNEDPKDTLDQILQNFNDKWFKGWDATPDDQKTKLLGVAKAVVDDEDYQSLVVGNPDNQAVDSAMVTIVDRIMRKMRKGDNSLYKEYQHSEVFKHGFIEAIKVLLSDVEYVK